MNTHYGPPEHLPFDLRHKRWPVRFDLAPEATATDRRKTRDTLSDELQEIIKSYFESSRPRPDPFSPTHSTHNAAAYWRDGETLATLDAMPLRGRPEMALGYRATEPLIYLRLWPSEKIEPLTVQQLGDYRHSSIEPLCGRTGGWSWYRNRFGTLAYATDGANRLASSTQVFKSGEIWGVHARFLRREAEERENFPDYIPTQAYEQGMRESLKRYLDVATQHFGYPPVIHVAAGLVNVNGFKLAMSNHDFWGPIFDDVGVVTTVDVESPSTTIDALLKIFDATYESAGHQRPQGLYGFPHKL
jgi:hypothetical protein